MHQIHCLIVHLICYDINNCHWIQTIHYLSSLISARWCWVINPAMMYSVHPFFTVKPILPITIKPNPTHHCHTKPHPSLSFQTPPITVKPIPPITNTKPHPPLSYQTPPITNTKPHPPLSNQSHPSLSNQTPPTTVKPIPTHHSYQTLPITNTNHPCCLSLSFQTHCCHSKPHPSLSN